MNYRYFRTFFCVSPGIVLGLVAIAIIERRAKLFERGDGIRRGIARKQVRFSQSGCTGTVWLLQRAISRSGEIYASQIKN